MRARRFQHLAALICVGVFLLLQLAACSGSDSSSGASADRFDAARAWRLVQRQVDFGQRPAGSPQLRRLALLLRSRLPHGHFESIPGEPALRNVVGSLPGAKPAIVIGAHYDTLAKPPGFVGANNGAAGTAVVVEAAHALQRIGANPGAHELRFVLFDGEEPPEKLPEESKNFYLEGLRGSRAYVSANRGQTGTMILLDYVGNRGVRLPYVPPSSKALWSRILIAAETVGAESAFSTGVGPLIIDDHTPFLRAGIPAVDLIDWRYPGHSLADRLSRISPRSLAAVGETIVQLAIELREE